MEVIFRVLVKLIIFDFIIYELYGWNDVLDKFLDKVV